MIEFLKYFITQKDQILTLSKEHLMLTFMSLFFATIIGVLGGVIVTNFKKPQQVMLSLANGVQAIPSIALLGFSIPFFGIGATPAIFAVTLYSILPILKSTITGINSVNRQTLEVANAIGMTKMQRLIHVQVPISFPIIMSGLRIAAVTGVGLMTMAAFVGAGGLGFLVFSGIRTVNTYQILCGAIPACIMALGVDFIAGKIENKISSRRTGRTTKKIIMTMVASIFLILSLMSINTMMQNKKGEFITIGGKDFTEQHILVYLTSELIKDRTGLDVRSAVNLGGTKICFDALKKGDIDMYVDYTGTIYGDVLQYPLNEVESAKIYELSTKIIAEKFELNLLDRLGFNNTYTLAMTKSTAASLSVKSISDLSRVADKLSFASSFECLNREDCYKGIQKVYNVNFKTAVGMDGSPRYLALNERQADVIDAFSTDGLLVKYDLLILDDDKSFFPPYDAVPIIRRDTLKRYPEIGPILAEISEFLNNDTMSALNYQVDELGVEPLAVARAFLLEHGLIER